MHPVLFQLGALKLYSYGLLMAIGFIVAIQWGTARAPLYHVSKKFISDLSLVVVVCGVVGGRLGHFVFETSLDDAFSLVDLPVGSFSIPIPRFFAVWQGGMVFYGGLILALVGIYAFCRIRKVSFLTVADVCAPPLATAHAIGRLGCFMAGCCYGKQCSLPWGVVFKDPNSLAPKNIPLHPTQLYEAIGLLILVGILLLVQKRQKFNGEIFGVYLILYSILRPTVEHFRGDFDRGFIDFWGLYPNEWLSTSTFISAFVILIALIVLWKNRHNPSPLANARIP